MATGDHPHFEHFGVGILPKEERDRLEAEQQKIAALAKAELKKEVAKVTGLVKK